MFLVKRIRGLRTESTDAERKLWSILRDRQLSDAKFRRQHQFGPYVLDFYCPEHDLAVEADGGQHFTEEGELHDEARTAYLQSKGIRVLRFTDSDILTNIEGLAATIQQAIEDPPSPVLGPAGRRPASPRGRGAIMPPLPLGEGWGEDERALHAK